MSACKTELCALMEELAQVNVSAAFPAEDIEAMKTTLNGYAKAIGDAPAEAERLTAEAAGKLEAFLNGRTPKASFHVVSDVHINGKPGGTDAWAAALKDMAKVLPESNIAFVSAGDMTNGSRPEQMDGFYNTFNALNPVPDEKVLMLLGNHDVRGWDYPHWSRYPYVGCPYWPNAREDYKKRNARYMPEEAQETLYHSKVLGGYTFLMFNTVVGVKDAMYMSPEMIAWFEDKMRACYEEDPHKPVFIISHQPLNNTHWRSNVLEGFDGLGNEPGTGRNGQKRDYSNNADEQVKAIMTKYPVGVFLSGHIHNQFGMAEVQTREYGITVDIPAFGQPEIGIPDIGTGYEVEIFDDELIFRCRNFTDGRWLPKFDTVLPLPLVTDVYQQAKRRQEEKTATPALTAAVTEAQQWMTRTYDQEGIPWDTLEYPEEILFTKPVLDKMNGLRSAMVKEME